MTVEKLTRQPYLTLAPAREQSFSPEPPLVKTIPVVEEKTLPQEPQELKTGPSEKEQELFSLKAQTNEKEPGDNQSPTPEELVAFLLIYHQEGFPDTPEKIENSLGSLLKENLQFLLIYFQVEAKVENHFRQEGRKLKPLSCGILLLDIVASQYSFLKNRPEAVKQTVQTATDQVIKRIKERPEAFTQPLKTSKKTTKKGLARFTSQLLTAVLPAELLQSNQEVPLAA